MNFERDRAVSRRVFVRTAALTALAAAGPSRAQEVWPARPVRFIVPSSPGGGTATPAAIIERMASEAAAIHRSPAFTARVESQGLVTVQETQAELVQALRAERQAYGAFIRRNAIVASD